METDNQKTENIAGENMDLDSVNDNSGKQIASDIPKLPAKRRAISDSDDESDSENQPKTEIPQMPKPVEKSLDLDLETSLKIYYGQIFPFEAVYNWLSYGNVTKYYFDRRELSFTFSNEIVARFISYSSATEMRDDFVRRVPTRFDLGAVYNAKPKDKKMIKAGQFVPLERELVFDIDMTDYDEIRTCCSGGDVCRLCWDFMTVAIKIIHRVLTEDFGFEHLLWVYSGRRGVHCWVCDERARKLTVEGRKAIVHYIEVVKGGDSKARKVNLPTMAKIALHPSLTHALSTVIEPYFRTCVLEKQKVLENEDSINTLLQLIPDPEIRNQITEHFNKTPGDSNTRWDAILNLLSQRSKQKANLKTCERDILFQYTYPRLDDKVTTGLNHLLKAPFCIHPKTGRVCVPIDPERCEEFDPLSVVTLNQILEDVNGNGIGLLKPHIEYFEKFIARMVDQAREMMRLKAIEEDSKKYGF